MNPRSLVLKLLPVALVAIIGVALTITTPPKADAIVSSVSASPPAIISGGSTSISLSATDDSGNLTINVANALQSQLSLTACSGGDGTITLAACQLNSSGDGTSAVTINTDGLDSGTANEPLAVGLTLTANCAPNTTMTVNVIDGTNGQSAQVFCSGGPAIWIAVSATTVFCGGSLTVQAIPPGAQVNSIVSFAATAGSFSPSSVAFDGNIATSTYTSPSTSGVATIAVTNGPMTAQAQIAVTCPEPTAVPTAVATPEPTAIPAEPTEVPAEPTAVPAEPTTVPVEPTVTTAQATVVPLPPVVVQPLVITPPNTGDGGLR